MALSVTAAVDAALARTRRVLFGPFDTVKWIKLGFCAFLARLGEGGGLNLGGNYSGGEGDFERGREWAGEHLALLLLIAVPVVLLLLVLWLVFLWLRCRGRFMFLDGVLKNRGAVAEPWRVYAPEANSLFAFSAALQLGASVLMLLAAGLGLLIAWPDIQAGRFDAAAIAGISVGGLLFLALLLALVVVDTLLDDFVVPAMYARRVRTVEGFRIVRRELLDPHTGAVFLYLLMRVALALAITVLVLLAVCVTLCCLACVLALPYVGTVLMLPVLVFLRCYALCFLEQLGGEWKLFAWSAQPAEAPGT